MIQKSKKIRFTYKVNIKESSNLSLSIYYACLSVCLLVFFLSKNVKTAELFKLKRFEVIHMTLGKSFGRSKLKNKCCPEKCRRKGRAKRPKNLVFILLKSWQSIYGYRKICESLSLRCSRKIAASKDSFKSYDCYYKKRRSRLKI